MTETAELTNVQVEQLKLFQAFCALGLDELDALKLAEADASPSQARCLIHQGCGLSLIAEILA